jgi:ATP-dependent DNA helicase RecQ
LELLRGYADTRGCRRQFLLTYFGVEASVRCGRCDNDLLHAANGLEEPVGSAPNWAVPFSAGDRVAHPRWGSGQVLRVEGDSITVLFDTVGHKVLAAGIVLEQGLLRKAS